MPTAVPDLNAAVLPGLSAAGIVVGSSINGLLSQAHPSKTEHLSACVIYSFPSVKVWAVDGSVDQVGVYSGYRGLLEHAIGIGSTVAVVETWCQCEVEEDDNDNLIVPSKPGWCFETEPWSRDHSIGANRNSHITAIFVYRANSRT
jgi:hypothetical protein